MPTEIEDDATMERTERCLIYAHNVCRWIYVDGGEFRYIYANKDVVRLYSKEH